MNILWLNLTHQQTNVNIQNYEYLHCNRKIVLGLWREKHVDCFLWKGLITCRRCSNLNNVQLQWAQKYTSDIKFTTVSMQRHNYLFPHGRSFKKKKKKQTFPPACPRTAKQKSVDSSEFPSILNWANPAAWPSIGCDTFLSTE